MKVMMMKDNWVKQEKRHWDIDDNEHDSDKNGSESDESDDDEK